MNDITKRFIDICNVKRFKQIEIAAIAKTTRQTISAIFTGRQNINPDILGEFLKGNPDIDARFIMTGEREIRIQPETVKKGVYPDLNIVQEPQTSYRCIECVKKEATIDLLQKQIKEKEVKMEEQSREIGMLRANLQALGHMPPQNTATG